MDTPAHVPFQKLAASCEVAEACEAILQGYDFKSQQRLADNLSFTSKFFWDNEILLRLWELCGVPYSAQKRTFEQNKAMYDAAARDMEPIHQTLHANALDVIPHDSPELAEIRSYYDHVYLLSRHLGGIVENIQTCLPLLKAETLLGYLQAGEKLEKIHEHLDMFLDSITHRGGDLSHLPAEVAAGVRELNNTRNMCYNIVTRWESLIAEYVPNPKPPYITPPMDSCDIPGLVPLLAPDISGNTQIDYRPLFQRLAALRQTFHRLVARHAESLNQTETFDDTTSV